MSVILGDLVPDDKREFQTVEVMSADYSAGWIRMEQQDPDLPDCDTIVIDRKQMQELSVIIDRFLT